MANLIRRNNNRETAPATSEYRWDPFRMMDALLRWDPFRSDFGTSFGGSGGYEFAPRFDVKEVKDGYLIKADLPGVKEEELSVSLTGNQLTVNGKREEEQRDEGERYYAMERSYGTFARTFSLPDSVDAEHVTADLKDGVLAIHIPKRPEAQPKKILIGKSEGKAKA